MRIEWVNHASFIVDGPPVRLLCDPWVEGTAFDNGWAHLTRTRVSFDELSRVSHIWFSHEHPDHFSPPNLSKLPAEARARITVLYQRTRDGRVAAFCRQLGFREVVELPPGVWRELGPGCRILCQPHGDGDSWLLARIGDRTLLNLNDCVIETEHEVQRVKKRIAPGQLDVLFTQFSYAAWSGNPEDRESRRVEALRKLAAVQLQARRLEPTYVVPFASFVWFCHVENYYMNDAINRVEDVARLVADTTASRPIVLYPGETWTVGAPHDSEDSSRRYAVDHERVLSGPELRQAPSVGLEELVREAQIFVQRLKQDNGAPTIRALSLCGLLRPARIHLHDLGRSVELSVRGLRPIEAPTDACDVTLGSEALAYCLRHRWGGSTLTVNGRFRVPERGSYRNFRRYFTLAALNNEGKTLAGYLPTLIGKLRRKDLISSSY